MNDALSIEIILSAAVQKRWRIKPTVRASGSPIHWLGQWRVDFGRKPDRTLVALVTNTTTLYTFVFPERDLGRNHNFEDLFLLRLGFLLVDTPSLASWKAAPIAFVAGNPSMAVGAMNNMRQLMIWRGEAAAGPDEDDEEWINSTPFAALPEIFPRKELARRLAEMATATAQQSTPGGAQL
jgi:hypothetical protein